MPRILQAFLMSGVWLVAAPAVAQEPLEERPSDDPAAPADSESAAADESASEVSATEVGGAAQLGIGSAAEGAVDTPPSAPQQSISEAEPGDAEETWDTFVSGYFRAPMSIGISPRPSPDNLTGPTSMQYSFGPNRTVDSNYFSFAYTRLQEQDWVEVFIHAKKKHAEAVVGWMGYWLQSAGFRNYDAAWAPGVAYLTLDTDFEIANIEPNIALTAGAWWPKFGTFDKYDTYTLGRFRQLGEQLRLTVPLSSDLTVTLIQGFGTSRDGSFALLAPPPYQSTTGLDLLHYENISVTYKEYFNLGLHYNTQWTRDPNLFRTTEPGKAFTDAKEAHLSTVGGEMTLSAPYAGSLWVSPSYIHVANGWALAEAGTEVMHSLTADGLAANYLGWSGSLSDSTGTGSLFNVGFLYENTLSSVLGKPQRRSAPEVTLNVFGLMTNVNLELPAESIITQDQIKQLKYGADLEYQPLDWLGLMIRYDQVNYDLDNPGYIFSAVTPRVTFSSHFLSGESIYLQYSRYRYGDAMVLAGRWPWGTPLVAGSDIIQGGPYNGHKPDMDVVKLQASASF